MKKHLKSIVLVPQEATKMSKFCSVCNKELHEFDTLTTNIFTGKSKHKGCE